MKPARGSLTLLRRRLPILEWGAEYTGKTLVGDLVAAAIVSMMLIPQSLAYALLVGARVRKDQGLREEALMVARLARDAYASIKNARKPASVGNRRVNAFSEIRIEPWNTDNRIGSRPTIFSLPLAPASMTSRVTLVALRTINASKPPMSATSVLGSLFWVSGSIPASGYSGASSS